MSKNATVLAVSDGRKMLIASANKLTRLNHIYIIGRTGTGKSTLLETIATQDILHGHGLCVIDPHGDLVTRLRTRVPVVRLPDLLYVDPAQPSCAYTYNPLRSVPAHLIPLSVSGTVETMKKLWSSEWGNRMEHILRNTLYALLEYGDASLPDVIRMFTDDAFRAQVVGRVRNEQVLQFWNGEFSKYAPRYRQDAIAPLQNKIGAFLADPRLRRMVSKGDLQLSFREAMDNGRIVLINLSKGVFGDDSASLLGALFVSGITLAGLSRANVPDVTRRPFFVSIDEFQSYTTHAVANMVSELRKYGIGLTLANQHLAQLDPDIRHAVLGNVGTLISFRVGPEDATILAKEFEPVFSAYDLINLPNHSIYLKLMIDGAPSRPFSADTLHPDQVIQMSQAA